MKKLFPHLLFFSSFLLQVIPPANAQSISNVSFRQSGDSVIVSYDLKSGHPEDRFVVTLLYSSNGGISYRPLTVVEGDVGIYVTPGLSHEIFWFAVKEEGRFYNRSVRFKVQAEIIFQGKVTDRPRKPLQIGLRFSPLVTFTKITNDQASLRSVSDEVGFLSGLTATHYLSYFWGSRWYLHTGFHIVSKGFFRLDYYVDPLFGLSVSSQNIKVTSLEMPISLLGQYDIGNDGIFATWLLGSSVGARVKYTNYYTKINPVTRTIRNSGTLSSIYYTNTLTTNLLAGAGIGWRTDRVGTFNIGLTYHQGLLNLNNRINFGNEEIIKVNYWSIDVGYMFW